MAALTRSNAPAVPALREHHMAGPVQEYLNNLIGWAQREFQRRPEANTAQDAVYLSSPDGSVYRLSVSDAGAAVFTLVSSP